MRLPKEVDESYHRIRSIGINHSRWGKWQEYGTTISIDAINEYAYGFFGTDERNELMFETWLDIKADGTKAGILVEVEEDMSSGYFLEIDPLQQNVIFNKWPEHQDFHWETFLLKDNPDLKLNQEVDNPLVLRPLAYIPEGNRYNIKIIRKDSAIECFIADQVCASFRIYRNTTIPFGVFVSGGCAKFSNSQLRN